MTINREEFDLIKFRQRAKNIQRHIGEGLEACDGKWRLLVFPRTPLAIARNQIIGDINQLATYIATCDSSTIPGRSNSTDSDPETEKIGIQLRSIIRTSASVRRLLRGKANLRHDHDLQHFWHSYDRCLWSIEQLCGEQPDGPNWMNQFWWNYEPHDLPPKPYKLLLMLWTAEGNCCSDLEISYRIWGKGQNRNTLKQVIKQLNKFLSNMGCPYVVSHNSGSVEILRWYGS